ncbi:FtsQ-type POTRA domain-containing protein [bacterium]|nr:FtsQ-type POTRA domain-containing protein [bacterium]
MDGNIKKPKNYIIERVKRFKPVAFIRKNIVPIVLLIAFVVSLFCGVWNIKNYEIYLTGDSFDENVRDALLKDQVIKYLTENVGGRSFFGFTTTSIENEIYENIPYAEKVHVTKSAPNKLIVFVEFYKSSVVAQVRDSICYLLSDEGIVLDELCTTSDDTSCCKNSVTSGKYFLQSDEMNISEYEDGKDRLLVMNTISKIVKLMNMFKFTVNNVVIADNVITITDSEGKVTVFTLSDNIDIQLARYYAVMTKIKRDDIKFSTLDVRFERPVMKN